METPALSISATATATYDGGSIQAFIPPGTYDILLLAGTSLQGGIFGQPTLFPGFSLRLLMASSSIRDREIVLDSVNQIHMVLGTLDVDITAPTQALAGQNFPVSVEIAPNNPLVMEELRRSPRTVSVDFDRVSVLGDFSAPLTEVKDNLLRADITATAPSTPGGTVLLTWILVLCKV